MSTKIIIIRDMNKYCTLLLWVGKKDTCKNSMHVSHLPVERWYCVSRQSLLYRQPHYSPVQYATGYMRSFCGKVRKIMVNLIKFVNSMNPYLLSMQIIASFVSWRLSAIIRRYFCLLRCVRYCTLSSERFVVHSITWCKVSVQ